MRRAKHAIGELPESECVCLQARLGHDRRFSDIVVTKATTDESAAHAIRIVEAMTPVPEIPAELSCIYEQNPWHMSFGGRRR